MKVGSVFRLITCAQAVINFCTKLQHILLHLLLKERDNYLNLALMFFVSIIILDVFVCFYLFYFFVCMFFTYLILLLNRTTFKCDTALLSRYVLDFTPTIQIVFLVAHLNTIAVGIVLYVFNSPGLNTCSLSRS